MWEMDVPIQDGTDEASVLPRKCKIRTSKARREGRPSFPCHPYTATGASNRMKACSHSFIALVMMNPWRSRHHLRRGRARAYQPTPHRLSPPRPFHQGSILRAAPVTVTPPRHTAAAPTPRRLTNSTIRFHVSLFEITAASLRLHISNRFRPHAVGVASSPPPLASVPSAQFHRQKQCGVPTREESRTRRTPNPTLRCPREALTSPARPLAHGPPRRRPRRGIPLRHGGPERRSRRRRCA